MHQTHVNSRINHYNILQHLNQHASIRTMTTRRLIFRFKHIKTTSGIMILYIHIMYIIIYIYWIYQLQENFRWIVLRGGVVSFLYLTTNGNRSCAIEPRCWPVKRAVQALWKTPYFLQSKRINAEEALDSFELWFSLAGGGALSHADVSWLQISYHWCAASFVMICDAPAMELRTYSSSHCGTFLHFWCLSRSIWDRRIMKWRSHSNYVGQRNGVWPCTRR